MATYGMAKVFEEFIESLLAESGVTIQRNREGGFDLYGKSERGTRAAIEVKLYSSGSVSPTLLQRAAVQLAYAAQTRKIAKAILVTNVVVPQGIERELRNSLGVIVYDHAVISGLASNHLELAEQWNRIIGLTRVFRTEYETEPRSSEEQIDPIAAFDAPSPALFAPENQLPPPPQTGASLADEIENIPDKSQDFSSRKKAAAEFENKCAKALRYVFSEDLTAWEEQSNSDAGLHRFDLIARISSSEDFWECLIKDFRARYVIFEFKNYAEQITQKEIYTTEKYLYPAAMRGAAIIISRKGANANAASAARGALRETGKLIINVSIADLRSMLLKRDNGESGADVLVQRLDQMLMTIER